MNLVWPNYFSIFLSVSNLLLGAVDSFSTEHGLLTALLAEEFVIEVTASKTPRWPFVALTELSKNEYGLLSTVYILQL